MHSITLSRLFSFILLLFAVTQAADFNAAYATGKRPGNAHISAAIPEQWKNNISKDVNGDVTTFSLVNGDAAPVFLFSITEISEQEWIKVKTQLPDVKLIARKDGNIYFSDKNQKEKIKGPSSDLYQQIYPHIDQMITNIQID